MGLPENYLRFFMNLKYVLDFNFPLVVGCFSDCVLLNLNVLLASALKINALKIVKRQLEVI